MARRVKIGDIFEVETQKGFIYFQYVYKRLDKLQTINVFNYVSKTKLDLEEIDTSNIKLTVEYPVTIAYNRDMIDFIGNKDFSEFIYPKYRIDRALKLSREDNARGWDIVDTDTLKRKRVINLNDEEKKLSPSGWWNPTFLIEWIELYGTLENYYNSPSAADKIAE